MYAYNPNTASETVALIEFEKKKEEERRMMINREIDVRMRLVFVGKIRTSFLGKVLEASTPQKKKGIRCRDELVFSSRGVRKLLWDGHTGAGRTH